MRILSVRQPWAHAILHYGKDVENRSWATPYRGPVAIHASRALDQAGAHLARTMDIDLAALPRGVILGCVTLDTITTDAASPWAQHERWHWQLSDPRVLPEPLPYRGCLRLGYLDPAVSALLAERTGGTYTNDR